MADLHGNPELALRQPRGVRGPLAHSVAAPRVRVHMAFWVMVRRVTVLAALVDLAFWVFFQAIGSPVLAWLNLVSVAMYAAAYGLLLKRKNLPALALIWTEVIAHATIGTMMLGWSSGFHYYLLMFIPAIMVSGGWRAMVFPLAFLFLSYVGLQVLSNAVGAMSPISGAALSSLSIFNIAIFFAMASYTARYYYRLVRKTERKLQELATQDALTGLSNRRHLLEQAEHEMARAKRNGEPISILLADIDNFKQINDQRGHVAGDQVLVHTAKLFRSICRTPDIVARWGGEEFLFLLPSTGAEAAERFAERVRSTIRATAVDLAGERIGFTISLGVSTLATR
jgi:diguanylate cyclase (GGDEF)-like protein